MGDRELVVKRRVPSETSLQEGSLGFHFRGGVGQEVPVDAVLAAYWQEKEYLALSSITDKRNGHTCKAIFCLSVHFSLLLEL